MTEQHKNNTADKVDINEELITSTQLETVSSEVEANDNRHQEPNINNKLSLLLDIGVTLSIEMGSKHIKLKDLLKLNKNSIVELDRMAGDPLDIKVNGSLIARGEVVVINEHYGIRITEIVSHHERIESV